METATLEFTQEDLQVLDRLLQQAPYAVAAPLIGKINAQLAAQRDATLKEVGEIRAVE